ncbi:pirin family protein [Alicyclobacillus cycloheptanicus]|uniref:Redox-sensitive bicupin YhaK (Pirin superfamily) n=1 Tax=Alicyclobacillus cycloheptanicus TaxID=1457 RepID=A0ABT9XJJ5_9BACL|nr:pirin family protein [Alicyclobacillus cycloheptanicus]MDQ0190453.1 redox-sensitive bicupin YhaK (pirin superfamily) [Alicyclobacillus cycloheptanicus]WDM02692.1 pirin family protein [Alicyclobacillus cycloheptanicus]
MLKVYPAASRFADDHGWLKTYHSFSFADYYDPSNVNFGPMRVLNDDTVAPARGFGPHPHREMEIVSIVLKGQLQHRDNTGITEIIKRGDVQRMSAGTGIVHSEMNPSPTEEVNFLQLWFEPNEYGLQPSYEQVTYDEANMKNALLPVVSNRVAADHVAYIHQDLTLYLSQLEAGRTLTFTQAPNRRVFLFVTEGALTLNQDTHLERRDAARITEVTSLDIQTVQGATFLLIDLC